MTIDHLEKIDQELGNTREIVRHQLIALCGLAVPMVEGGRIGVPSQPWWMTVIEPYEAN
ncbi:MAG: hypothetical protein QOJ54_697, partial [Aliidongia sp.]|nr:hypothetical protein [Aliidongia sp.]